MTVLELRRVVRRYTYGLAAITFLYTAPYALLALAPQPAPVIGLVFCAGAAVVCASLHVMTPTMIFFTLPAVLVGLVSNGVALSPGWPGLVLGALAALVAGNAVVMARAGAASFGELIAARIKAEEAAEQLELRVQERTAQLSVATRRALEANRAKSAFLANMSHELRTPLNAVIGYAELIEEDLATGDTERCSEDLGRIRTAASHLLKLITEVLDLSRIEAGKLKLEPCAVDVAPIVQEAVETVQPLAAKNGTTCRISIADDMGLAFADDTRVRQCVLNLLSNAVKFTQDGVVSVELRRCRIGAEPGVAIAVRDTGVGIAAEDLARLFHPFEQVDSSVTRKHEGAGLGLVITRRLARAMGGEVTAKSVPGRGSLFTLYLPAAAAAQAAA